MHCDDIIIALRVYKASAKKKAKQISIQMTNAIALVENSLDLCDISTIALICLSAFNALCAPILLFLCVNDRLPANSNHLVTSWSRSFSKRVLKSYSNNRVRTDNTIATMSPLSPCRSAPIGSSPSNLLVLLLFSYVHVESRAIADTVQAEHGLFWPGRSTTGAASSEIETAMI